MSKSDKDLMGYDPLEWLREEQGNDAPAGQPASRPDENTMHSAASPGTPPASREEPDDTITAPSVPEEQNSVSSEPDSSAVFNFEGSLQIMDVAILKPQLVACLNGLKEITLRADPDIVVDGAGIQLLLAFVQQAEISGVRLRWETLPSPIAEAARLLNAEPVLLQD